jgi:hypothetical protein
MKEEVNLRCVATTKPSMSTNIATKVVLTAMTGRSISMRPGCITTSIPTPTGTMSTTTSAVVNGKPRVY